MKHEHIKNGIDMFTDNIDFISQLPGLVVWKNENSEYMFTNALGAIQLGFNNQDETIGITDDQIHCQASKCAELFISSDKKTFRYDNLELIDINTWADKRKIVSFTKKKKFYYKDNGIQKVGVVFYSTEVTDNMLLKIANHINNNDFKKNVSMSSCYEIKNEYSCFNLSCREAQCLFFLARGCSVKKIAKVLGLSDRTVQNYIELMREKLGLNNRSDLIEYAHHSGFMATIPKQILMTLVDHTIFE